MREILFRGKEKDGGSFDGKWRYGDLVRVKEGSVTKTRIFEKNIGYLVVPETVGEYTGLTDKNGKKIFEGDIIRSNSERGYIEYYPNDCAFDVVDDHGFYWLISEMSNIEVIGNIHDNPELLEEKS